MTVRLKSRMHLPENSRFTCNTKKLAGCTTAAPAPAKKSRSSRAAMTLASLKCRRRSEDWIRNSLLHEDLDHVPGLLFGVVFAHGRLSAVCSWLQRDGQ